MPSLERWFDRRFAFDFPASRFPSIVERLRGTPARLEERVADVSANLLTLRFDDAWSIQEHAGHLLDLEPLWLKRLQEFLAGASTLVAADLTNRATETAGHNARALEELLQGFRTARAGFVSVLERADDGLVARTAMHPRLLTPMRLVDHAFFVAEHDDHHLASISALLRRRGEG
jgi:uncharacterized damage-inducible protein DinB